VPAPLLIGPDQESEQWVAAVARPIECPHLILSKQRRGDREVEVSPPDASALRDRTPVVIDDIISSAQTMCVTVRRLAAAGARPICIGVHAVLAGDALQDLHRAGATQVVTCNTLVHPTNAVDVLPELAAAVHALAGEPGSAQNPGAPS
jgi:ribose-phosphate pyrophosphokinase